MGDRRADRRQGREAGRVHCGGGDSQVPHGLSRVPCVSISPGECLVSNAPLLAIRWFRQLNCRTKVMDVNVNGVLFTAQAAGRQMARFGNGGSIVLIASMSGSITNKVRSSQTRS